MTLADTLIKNPHTIQPTYDWLVQAAGINSAISHYKKFGRVIDASTSAFVPVCIGSIYRVPQSGSATALRIKAGGNANDTAEGSGARSVKLTGLDDSFTLISPTLATAGASASDPTSELFTRLMYIEIAGSGTYADNVSTYSHAAGITIENAAGGTDWGSVDATTIAKGRSEIGFFSAPSNTTNYVFLTSVTADASKTFDLIFYSRESIDDTAAPYQAFQSRFVGVGINGGAIHTFGENHLAMGGFAGPCDIGFMAKSNTTAATISVNYEIFSITSQILIE